jgi:ectoine hydroxylase-related dioxygenase (phytanoyl-CoA dioxygenase family)
MTAQAVPRYGVREQTNIDGAAARAAEAIRILGFAIVETGMSGAAIREVSSAFDRAYERAAALHGGAERLRALDEHNTIRSPLLLDEIFLRLAQTEEVLEVCRALLGDYFILNQQNGIINPPHGERYNQGAFHRDLPYQHFVCSRPLAINALFCVDDFTADNGPTLVVPGTHRQEAFPSDDFVRTHAVRVTAPRGSFIVLDCMVYHAGSANPSAEPRRAVNHV